MKTEMIFRHNIDQYGNYKVDEVDVYLNGINTQGENIADNGGVRESFRAYKLSVDAQGPEPKLPGLLDYTPEQMFFISYAQVSSGLLYIYCIRQKNYIFDRHKCYAGLMVLPRGALDPYFFKKRPSVPAERFQLWVGQY